MLSSAATVGPAALISGRVILSASSSVSVPANILPLLGGARLRWRWVPVQARYSLPPGPAASRGANSLLPPVTDRPVSATKVGAYTRPRAMVGQVNLA